MCVCVCVCALVLQYTNSESAWFVDTEANRGSISRRRMSYQMCVYLGTAHRKWEATESCLADMVFICEKTPGLHVSQFGMILVIRRDVFAITSVERCRFSCT